VVATPTTTATEEYDGTTWTSVESMNTARNACRAAGTQTAALAFGGDTPPSTSATEEYDGTYLDSMWNALEYSKRYSAGAGIQTAALAFGGETHQPTGATEEYDGTSWTSGGSLNTARRALAGAGTQTAALAFGGDTPAVQEQQNNMMEQLGQQFQQVWIQQDII
jgi:hypothetical protein